MDSIDIVLNNLSSSQIALLITSSCIQFLIILGYLRAYITKKPTIQILLFPLLFLCLILTSISFGLRPNTQISTEKEKKTGFKMKYINSQIFLYSIVITILCILILVHFFIKNLLSYKNIIHFWTVFLIFITIILSTGLIYTHGNEYELSI